MSIHHSVFKNPFEVKTQDVNWVGGMPCSIDYDDRFFQADAINEIHDVFIEPNNLENRLQEAHQFTIGELGFGFGMNFLVTALLWNSSKHKSEMETLDYVSIEEALPTKDQILKVIKSFPELEEIGGYFLSSYSPMHNDMQRINLPELNIRLTLIQNNAESALQNLLGFSNNLIDAWYLDGFDPAKNKNMWSSSICQLISLLSSNEATFGTFTSAGFVKRNLTKFGFEVSKVSGFGKKRHKLIGKIIPRKHFENPSHIRSPKIAIIGSGIAGSCAAYAAANHGMQVDVFEYGQEAGCGTSSNPIAAMYPRFSASNSPYAHLIAQSYFFADRIYSQFPDEYKRTGLLFTHFNKYQTEWLEDMMSLKREDIFQLLQKVDMKNTYGLDSKGLKVLQGGYLFPQELCKRLLENKNIEIYTDHCFESSAEKDTKLSLHFSNQVNKSQYDALVIANGAGLLNSVHGLKISKGQLIGLNGKQDITSKLPINSEGYILPPVDGVTWIGSTHQKEFDDLQPSDEVNQELLKRTENNFKIKLHAEGDLLTEARARVGSKDRLPIAGRVSSDQNIYALGALGSRGFSLAPLMGEYIASQISNSPNPISTGIALSVNPMRFKD